VTLRVNNGNEPPGSISFLLLPRLIVPAGQIEVAYSQAPALPVGAPNIAVGNSYIFGFTVTAKANRAGNYAVTAAVAGWATELLEDAVDNPRASNSFAIAGNPAGTDQKVRIRVTVPAGASPADVKTLTVNVVETTPQTLVAPGTISTTLSVGQPAPTPEIRVRPALVLPGPTTPRGAASLDGIKVRFTRTGAPLKGTGGLQFRIAFSEAGSYALQGSFSNPAGWDLTPISSPLVIASGLAFPTNQVLDLELTANATASATDFIFQITRGTDIRVQYRLGLTVA
jgi:hypothetical protein